MKKLKLFMAAFALLLGWSNAMAQETPSNGNAYYIYNADNDLFFTRGADWGTQAIASPVGLPWRVEVADGKYTLKMYDIYTQNDADKGLGFNGSYTDNGSPIALTPNGDATNGFTLENGGNYITCPTSKGAVSMSSTASKWQFLTQAQYNAVMASRASAQESAVATSKGIVIPGGKTLNEVVSDVNAWTSTTTADALPTKATWPKTGGTQRGNYYNEGDYGVELFESNNASISKTISGLASGIYKVSVRGMRRDGTNASCVAMETAGFYPRDVYMEANGNIIPVKAWADDNTANDNPDSPAQTVAIINNGGYTSEGFVYVGDDGKLNLTVYTDAFWWGCWFVFNGVSYTFYNNEVSDEDATAILATATALEAQEMDADLLSALSSAKTTFDGARTIANYNALQTAIDAAQASADAYALFAPERTKALALGMSAEAIAALAPDVHALMVAEYNFVNTNYSYGVSLGTWTKVNATDRRGQHWDGTTGDGASTYSEQADGWDKSSWTCSYSQDIALPAGNYVFKVAGRKSSDSAVLTLTVKNGESTIGTVNDFPNGDTGKGIDTSGATNFGDGTFANGGVGRGWQWRYVKFTLADPATVNVAVNGSASAMYQWLGFCNATVQTDDADNVALMEALVALNSAKTAATLTKNTTNVGTGVFQLNETTNNTLWSAYSTAKSNAEAYVLTSSSTASEVNALATALTTATTNYLNQSLNAPDADKHYNIVVATAEHAKLGNAIVMDRVAEYPVYSDKYVSNNTGFTLNASATPNANLAQACVFTPVDGKANTYYIAMERVEGTVYLTYGSLNDSKVNWKADQIQATTDANKKGEFKIAATTTANQFNIINTANDNPSNDKIACKTNGDIYTANAAENAFNFTIAEASQATVDMTIAAGVEYATRIFPFKPTLPDGFVAYSCDGYENDNVLELETVSSGDLAANTPYILYKEGGYSGSALTGWGTLNTVDAKTTGWLTGVYEETEAPNGSYVLQNNNDNVAFYLVNTEKVTPRVGAYRCYLTTSSPTRAAYFFRGSITGVDNVEATATVKKNGAYLENGKIAIYKNGMKFSATGAKLK